MPGKQSLIEMLPHVQLPAPEPQPVQRKASGAAMSSDEPSVVARAGTAGAGSSLPYLDQIQNSFGHHDVSGVRSHQGGAAAQAADVLGAQAFAVGDAVGFASSPELYTAAHEAAHVVQQRTGVQLRGGIDGGAGDPYERHADAVADAVVRGESAESLLGGEPSHAAASTAVQRKVTVDPVTDEDTLPDSIKDFAIAPDGWSALVRTKWVTADPKERLFQLLQQMQRLGAFTWAKEEGLRRAADKTQALDGTREVVRYMVTLRTLAQMGLPPLSGAMVAREGDDLIIALKVPGVKDDDQKESHALGFDDSNMVSHAVEKFTHLTVQSHPRLAGLVIRDGIMEVQITDKQAAEMFGAKEWSGGERSAVHAGRSIRICWRLPAGVSGISSTISIVNGTPGM